MKTYNPKMGQAAIEAEIASDGLMAVWQGGLSAFALKVGETAPLGEGLDITGSGSSARRMRDVVRLFSAVPLRDDDYNLVCAVPGAEKHPPEGFVWLQDGCNVLAQKMTETF